MSIQHPIIAITGSSGAGTTTVSRVFTSIFAREGVCPAFVAGDAFHRYTRDEMDAAIAEAQKNRQRILSHFGPEANLWPELEKLFGEYAEHGTGYSRHYVHDEIDSVRLGQPVGQFTPWERLPEGSDLLFYEGLHGGIVAGSLDIARHVDLLIGVVPIINLEWIQKILRDTRYRGYSKEEVMQTILRRMPDYVHYITPQFSRTHINFQRVPVVDTSNPFIAADIPKDNESFVVIRFADPKGVDFPYLLSMIEHSFMSRSNTLVVPGAATDLAMQLILSPLILKLIEARRQN